MDDFAKDGGFIILSLGLAVVTCYLRMVIAAKSKGNEDPFGSAFVHLLAGVIGGVALNFLFPIFGFFIGFAITMKLLFWNEVSFFDALFAPLLVAMFAIGYFIGLSWLFGGLGDNNIIYAILGGLVLLVLGYAYSIKPLIAPEEPVALSIRKPKKEIVVVEKIKGKVYLNCSRCKQKVRIVANEITPEHPLYEDFKKGKAAWIADKRIADVKDNLICSKCISDQISEFWKKHAQNR